MQLLREFQVLDVLAGLFPSDPESLGWAAVIEWMNPAALPENRPFAFAPAVVTQGRGRTKAG